jgi:metal-responsive CopG/Arc/MetJ family transcriptional regulator
MRKRINVILPDATLQIIDRMTKNGDRSRFIDHAVRYYAANRSVDLLREQLERSAVRDRDLDREIAADWLAARSRNLETRP